MSLCSIGATRVGGGSVETTGRVGEHGIDLAGLRSEIGPRQHLVAVVARDLLEQPLELADIAIDGAAEIAVGAIALADFLERLLALQGVKLAREYVAFAALVAIPQLGCRVVVDHAGDVDRKRIERLEAVTLRTRALVGSAARRRRLARRRFGLVRGARQQLGEPAGAPTTGRAGRLRRAERGCLRPPRRYGRRHHAGNIGARPGRLAARAAVGALLACGAASGADLGRVHAQRRRLDRGDAAAVAGDDAIELGQPLRLLDHHA